jgi:N-acetyl-anhydromuramyl-L-alanine amidase AmpD
MASRSISITALLVMVLSFFFMFYQILKTKYFSNPYQALKKIEQSYKTPPPTQQKSWKSPLDQQCGRGDAQLRKKLLAMQLIIKQIKPHQTNYGLRLQKDLFNQQLDPTPSLIILHETVYDLESAVNTLLTPHPSDSDQVSYHTLVARNGEIIQLVQPELRAYGAGNSAFNGRWIFSNKDLSGSINNFALHVSLETPIDGSNDFESHGGYSSEQYDSLTRVLADWMVRYEIPADRITTHKFVDLGGERSDPRSFDWKQLQKRLGALDLICKK